MYINEPTTRKNVLGKVRMVTIAKQITEMATGSNSVIKFQLAIREISIHSNSMALIYLVESS